MAATTIQIDSTTREKLNEFRYSGETYDELLLRLYKSANERQLQEILMDSKDTISLEEFKQEVENLED